MTQEKQGTMKVYWFVLLKENKGVFDCWFKCQY